LPDYRTRDFQPTSPCTCWYRSRPCGYHRIARGGGLRSSNENEDTTHGVDPPLVLAAGGAGPNLKLGPIAVNTVLHVETFVSEDPDARAVEGPELVRLGGTSFNGDNGTIGVGSCCHASSWRGENSRVRVDVIVWKCGTSYCCWPLVGSSKHR
jgi:hypothetical protein